MATFVDTIRAAAISAEALILTAFPAPTEQAAALAVVLGANEFITLIAHVRPRLIYFIEETFDADEMIRGEDAEHSVELDPRQAALIRRWRQRDGELCLVAAIVIADGVAHQIIEEAIWVGELETEAAELHTLIKEERRALRDSKTSEEHKRLHTFSRQLAEDSRFVAPKISRAKRLFLASTLFESIDESDLWQVVERAENIVWLATNLKTDQG